MAWLRRPEVAGVLLQMGLTTLPVSCSSAVMAWLRHPEAAGVQIIFKPVCPCPFMFVPVMSVSFLFKVWQGGAVHPYQLQFCSSFSAVMAWLHDPLAGFPVYNKHWKGGTIGATLPVSSFQSRNPVKTFKVGGKFKLFSWGPFYFVFVAMRLCAYCMLPTNYTLFAQRHIHLLCCWVESYCITLLHINLHNLPLPLLNQVHSTQHCSTVHCKHYMVYITMQQWAIAGS